MLLFKQLVLANHAKLHSTCNVVDCEFPQRKCDTELCRWLMPIYSFVSGCIYLSSGVENGVGV